ncbi:unnamed protein product, partial [Prorocentrum cordatum]
APQGLPHWPGPPAWESDGELPEPRLRGLQRRRALRGLPAGRAVRRAAVGRAGQTAARASQLRRVERLRQRRRQLKSRLASQKVKEREFVAQMDRGAHGRHRQDRAGELGRRVWQLSSDNVRLRAAADQQAKEGVQQAERLAQSTKQVGENEARVQFLLDRIITLLSGASGADPELTEALASARQHERAVLRQLEEARRHFDEVQRQNGELTMRLTEELGLSRRLSDGISSWRWRSASSAFRTVDAAETSQFAADDSGTPARLGRLGLQTPGGPA